MHIFLNAVRTGEAGGAEEGETGRAAAFINREIDGDVSSSAAGSAGRGKKREEAERKEELAGCPMHRIDDEQHVDTVSPFIPRYQGKKIKSLQLLLLCRGGPTVALTGLQPPHMPMKPRRLL